jgi:predicted DNA-binding transcriptional regulator YafY
MRIERPRPNVFRVTLHAYELSALVAAARWVGEGAEGELPKEARDQLQQVLESYDAETRRLNAP